MKLKNRIVFLVCTVLVFLLLSICFVAAEVEPVQVTITYDKTSVNVGETITANYSITGGTGRAEVEFGWFVGWDNSDVWIYANNVYALTDYEVSSFPNSGSFTFTPEYGKKARVELYYWDPERPDDYVVASTNYPFVAIEGSTVEPYCINISSDKDEYYLGDTITASYSITGGTGKQSKLYAYWQFFDTDENGEYKNGYSTESIPLDSLSGELSHILDRQFGTLYINVEDELGFFDCGSIQFMTSSRLLNLDVSFDKYEVYAGDTVTASYSIKNENGTLSINDLTELTAIWRYYDNEIMDWIEDYSVDLTDLSGTLSYTSEEKSVYPYTVGLEITGQGHLYNLPRNYTSFDVYKNQETVPHSGDSNGDGVTDGRDSLRLLKYLAGQGVSIDEKASDLNGDGVVDGRDSIRLLKLLAN